MPSRSIALISRHCLTIPEASTFLFFFFNDTATTEIYTLSLLDALPISPTWGRQLYRTYATIGNHDYGLGNANGTWDYFGDRKSTRLNSSHSQISYAVLCLKKKILQAHHAVDEEFADGVAALDPSARTID